MFDSFHVHSAPREYVPYAKTVIEKRAPTDDSIRIYEEIKEKAYASILDTIQVNNNTFNCKAEMYKDILSFSTICYYEFTLNNKEVQGKIRVDEFKNKQEILKQIYKEASSTIALELINAL